MSLGHCCWCGRGLSGRMPEGSPVHWNCLVSADFFHVKQWCVSRGVARPTWGSGGSTNRDSELQRAPSTRKNTRPTQFFKVCQQWDWNLQHHNPLTACCIVCRPIYKRVVLLADLGVVSRAPVQVQESDRGTRWTKAPVRFLNLNTGSITELYATVCRMLMIMTWRQGHRH